MVFAVVRVFVAFAVAETFRALVMFIAQMFRHGNRATGTDVFQRGINRFVGGITFVCRGDVDGCFGQWNPRFRPADKFRRGETRIRQNQSHRVGETDIFCRANHDAPRDEARVFAGVNHFREPVKRRIRIATTHGFDKRGNRVVMRVAIAVIHHSLFLDALLGNLQRDANDAIRLRRGGERSNF